MATSDTSSDARIADLLIESLREALRLSNRYLMIALVASAISFSVVLTHDHKLAQKVSLSGVDMLLPPSWVFVSSVIVEFISMLISGAMLSRATYLAYFIQHPSSGGFPSVCKDLAFATLSYPSIFTIPIDDVRRFVVILPTILTVGSLIYWGLFLPHGPSSLADNPVMVIFCGVILFFTGIWVLGVSWRPLGKTLAEQMGSVPLHLDRV